MKSISSIVERTNEEDIIQILVEQAPVAVSIVQDGKFCYVNSYFSVATGYAEDELIERDSFEIVVPEDRRMVRESTIRMLKEELLTPYQFRVICKDSSIIWVMATVKSIQYHGRQAVLGNYMEITGRRQAEEELQAERNKLQSLVDALEDGLTIQDTDYNIIYKGRLQRTLFGDHLGEKCYRIYEGREKICEGCPVEKAFKDGKSHTAERRSVLPSGEVTFWENTANPIRDACGEIVSCLEVSRNITERKKQEQALADELTQRRLLIDKSLDGIVVLDVDAKVVEANHRFAEMLGYTLAEVYKLHTWDWDKNYTPEQILEMGRNVDEQGIHLKTKHTRKDGSIIEVDISISEIMYRGRKLIFCIQRDVTDRNRAEEALKNSEENYRELANSITDVFFAMDEHLRYTYWNKASEVLTGIRAEDAIGKSLLEIFPDSPGLRKAEKAYRAVLKTQKSRTFINDYDLGSRHYIFEINAYPSRGGISVFARDITERKQAEEALKEAEQEKSAFLEEAPVGIIHTDIKGNITYVNKRFESETGYSQKEIVGKSCFEIDWLPATTMRYLTQRMAARLKGSPAKHWETQFKCKNGQWIWITLEGKILRKSEVPVGFQIIATNVTEGKEAEGALRQSEERYRTILEEMEDAYFEVDLGGHFTFINNSVCRDLGYSREELMGMSYKKITIEEDIESLFEVFNEVYQTGVPNKGFPWRTIRKDGSRGFAETSVSLILGDEGKIMGFRGVGRDISERRKVEEALRQSEENYRVLFDSSVIGTIVLEADTLEIAMANQAATEIFGFSSVEEAQGIDLFDYIRPEDKDKIVEIALDNLHGQDGRQAYELGAFTKDGREIWINATGAAIKHEGKLAGLIAFTETTEQKKHRENIMMTDRLASLGELASGAAHELNNPLTSIIGFSQLLTEKEVPDDIREDLKLINNEARRAVIVTNNLLSFARKHSPTKQLNQVNNIIEDVLDLRAHEHKVNHINVERHLDPNLPEIMVDYFQMQQVFMNIIINAEYFMIKTHNGGTLTITTGKENSTVRISFADDGPGITEENLGRIFDPFFTTKEAGSGTGLGLSICHGIVNEHNGQIYAKSQLGKGTTIFMELPIKKRARVKSLI
jgi:two-component system NtrC family sensor kinase